MIVLLLIVVAILAFGLGYLIGKKPKNSRLKGSIFDNDDEFGKPHFLDDPADEPVKRQPSVKRQTVAKVAKRAKNGRFVSKPVKKAAVRKRAR